MTIGQRIKRIRNFRGMTQKQLGLLLGFGDSSDVRITQYESDARTPKSSVRLQMAKILGVSPNVLSASIAADRNDFMQSIFWMEDLKGGGDIYDCIKEWETMKNKYESGEISQTEYFEWKFTYDSPLSDLSE